MEKKKALSNKLSDFKAYYKRANRLRLEYLTRTDLWKKQCQKDQERLFAAWEDGTGYTNRTFDDSDKVFNNLLAGLKGPEVCSFSDISTEYSFTLTLSAFDYLFQIEDKIEAFKAHVLSSMESNIKENPLTYWITGIHRNEKGSFEQPLRIWERCLVVYDLVQENGEKWTMISKLPQVGHFDNCGKKGNTTNKGDPTKNAVSLTKRDFQKALKLIKSAETGTFPY